MAPNFAQGSIATIQIFTVGILLYVSGLLCSHLAAFRIASNMRKKALHHAVQLPLGYFAKEGSGKLRKIIDEAAASTETYLTSITGYGTIDYYCLCGNSLFIYF